MFRTMWPGSDEALWSWTEEPVVPYRFKIKDDKHVLRVSLPGYKKEDFTFDHEGKFFIIRIDANAVKENHFGDRQRIAFKMSDMDRYDLSKVKAKYQSGILSIEFLKVAPKSTFEVKFD